MTDETIHKLTDMLEDSACSALDIKLCIESLRGQDLSNAEKIKLTNLMISWHKAHHGEKHGIFNVNIDIINDLEKWFDNEKDKQS